ncbi:MAG: RNA 2',3'-cyclic phosphodiesterase [Chloroflexota bacterium]|jgi:2'-5' RNA ligase|nr:RNA 2',3'-cyclic phosphodiesterase [Anaerolineae bacterium]HMM28955.1 RNA 2',3'-cyclic phosphodiesterase [Aggregatilineaceae bacterium]
MAETWRLFIATTLPPGVLTALVEIQRALRADTPHGVVRWVEPGSIHLTLKFLGDAPSLQRHELEDALQAAAGARPPFELSLSDLGCFPSVRRPRVVWVGLAGALPALHALRDEIERQIAPLGYPTEDRPFSPHLTLGRVRREASSTQASALGAQVIRTRQHDRLAWPVTSVSLMRSELLPEGAVYTELHRVPLRATGAPPDTNEESC